jgi:hypothetical protein
MIKTKGASGKKKRDRTTPKTIPNTARITRIFKLFTCTILLEVVQDEFCLAGYGFTEIRP